MTDKIEFGWTDPRGQFGRPATALENAAYNIKAAVSFEAGPALRAQGIMIPDLPDGTVWCPISDEQACAAAVRLLRGLREPTPEMVKAGHIVEYEECPPWMTMEGTAGYKYQVYSADRDTAQRFRQMIDAVFKT